MATLRWKDPQGAPMPHSLQCEEGADGVECLLAVVKQNTQDLRLTIPKPITVKNIQDAWALQSENWEQLGHSSETAKTPYKAFRIIHMQGLGYLVWKVKHKKKVADDTFVFLPADADIDAEASAFMSP